MCVKESQLDIIPVGKKNAATSVCISVVCIIDCLTDYL